MNIEDIIPNVELCKLIPDGELMNLVGKTIVDTFNTQRLLRDKNLPVIGVKED